MKKMILFLGLFIGSLTAAADPLQVVTTIPDFAAITKEVGGSEVEVIAMAKGYQDPHFVEPKPSLLMDLRNADLLEVVGLELEMGWLPPLLSQSRNPRIMPGGTGYLDLSRGVEILDRPKGTVDRSMGDIHAMGNPHYWIEPGNAIRVAGQINNKLAELRPEKADEFNMRYLDFKLRVNEAHRKWNEIMKPFAGTKIVTYHNSWPNFVRRYDLDVVDYVEPKPGVPPSPAHTFQLIRKMKKEGVRLIVVEPYFDLKTPTSIAEKTGASVIVLYPSVGGKEGLDDWISLYDSNIRALAAAMKR